MRTGLRRMGHGAAVLLPLALAACQTLIKPPEPCGDDGCSTPPFATRMFAPKPLNLPVHEPKVATNPTVHALASDLDHLEKHIDWYGSVVAKTPDVWGQARLTRYREEFEKEMKPETNKFNASLQGSLARSDQAFFASATALSLAAKPKPPVIGNVSVPAAAPVQLVPQSRDIVVVNETTGKTDNGGTTRKEETVTTKEGTPTKVEEPKPAEGPIKLPTAVAAKDLVSDTDDVISREDLLKDRGIGFTKLKTEGISLEPSLVIAQKKRYLDFLNQLRRENEGDDIADAPGYSLNLIRIPVSLLPGKRTDVGHGAEVTMTLTPVLGDDLLPATFRNLVANDLLQQLGFPLTQFLNDRGTADKFLKPLARNVVIALPAFHKLNELHQLYQHYQNTEANAAAARAECDITAHLRLRTPGELDGLEQIAKLLGGEAGAELTKLVKAARDDIARLLPVVIERKIKLQSSDYAEFIKSQPCEQKHTELIKKYSKNYAESNRVSERSKEITNSFSLNLVVPPLSYSPGLVNKTGFPTSQLIDVYGLSDCFQIAFAANAAFEGSIKRQKYAHLPDIQGFLQQEIASAYRFLAEPECQVLWQQFCTPEMVMAVRTRKVDALQTYREQYRAIVKDITLSGRRSFNEPGEYTTTAALAWCILVDSALLNDRLKRDMRESASSKRRPAPPAEHWPQFYLPDPPPDARTAFNGYVAMRWPVRVFALDPYTEDQNIADQLSSRREMQLALSIAFTNGYIGVDTLNKYTRRLEADYETIALNRTQVGFSHGENTFGWRFYPRFQTPDTESNLTVFARDLLLGGPNRNQLLRQRRLEPGPRECVAVVMMPSFVPYADLDVTSNWFGLANPKHKVLDHTQSLKLSHTVHTIRTTGCGVKDTCKYRDGELDRLLRRAEQLEARLPAQTLSVPVPVLNTLGGFEMFNNGTTDLAPELYGWYGAPGVSADDDTTTLFLVGDHFSPLNTRVIVGNREVTLENQRMLSRQVVQVTVKRGNLLVTEHDRVHVQAHIATPYGVTRELLIPVVCPGKPCPDKAPEPKAAEPADKPKASKAEYKLVSPKLAVPYCKSGAMMDGKYALGLMALPEDSRPKLQWVPSDGNAAPKTIKAEFVFTYNNCELVVPVEMKRGSDDIYKTLGDPKDPKTWNNELAYGLFLRLNPFGPFTDSNNPLSAAAPNTDTKVLQLKRIRVSSTDKEVKTEPPALELTEWKLGVRVFPVLTLEPIVAQLAFTCQICEPSALVPKPEASK